MKRLAPIGLFALLLYNTFGLSLAVLLFPSDHRMASKAESSDDWMLVKMHLPSLPYAGDLSLDNPMEGLVRKGDQFYNPTEAIHQNDTLYVTLKSNQAARDHFFELANAIETLNNPDLATPQSAQGKAIKILSGLLKNYLPVSNETFVPTSYSLSENQSSSPAPVYLSYTTREKRMSTPPPEHI